MANTVVSQGTKLEVKSGSGAWTKVNGLKDFSGIGSGSASVIDATDLDSAAKEKKMGVPDEGQIKANFNLLPTDAGQTMLDAARSASALLSFRWTAGGVITYTHDGFVVTTDKSAGVDKLLEMSASIEITGVVTKGTVGA